MLTFPNAKINLGLHILRKRDDGFHDIETCLYPIPISDALEIIPSDTFVFSSSGLAIAGPQTENLCIRAFHLLKEVFEIPNVKMHLHKVIPMGAGLGGGSSDGAFTLKLLNELFELNLSKEKLKVYAGQLGSDCPFFIDNRPAIAVGTGTELKNFDLNLKGMTLALQFPKISVSTKEAYSSVIPGIPSRNLLDILTKEVSSWSTLLKNDFEPPIFDQYPELGRIKQSLYDQGALYAAMSGSGSTIFGIFDNSNLIKSNKDLQTYKI